MIESAIIEVEYQYFDILENYYSDLYKCYLDSDRDFNKALHSYLAKHPNLYVSGYKNSLTYKREQCQNELRNLWDKNFSMIEKLIQRTKSVGIYGVGDAFPYEFKAEISRNALFYDLLVFNDPLYKLTSSKEEFEMDQNMRMFYAHVIYVLDIKDYILTNNDQHFVLLFPIDAVLTDDETLNCINESSEEALKYVSKVFGIKGMEEWKDLEILKNLSLEEAQVRLIDNELYYRIDEAMNYSQALLSEEERRNIENFCYEMWGTFNRDFLKCILMKTAITNMATLSFSEFRRHNEISKKLKGNPILERNEWMPVKETALKNNFKANDDYLYCCSVHRNDKMQCLIDLSPKELFEIRSKNEPREFREFFHKVTEDMSYTYDELDEISSEVYYRFDDMLDKSTRSINDCRNKKRYKAIVGILKGLTGFLPVPLLSCLLTLEDIFSSGRDLCSTIKDQETIIEHLGKKKRDRSE